MTGAAGAGQRNQADEEYKPLSIRGAETFTAPEMLSHALAYARRGYRVFPIYEPGTNEAGCSCNDLKKPCDSPAKHPRTTHGSRDSTTDEAQIHAWWTRWPRANIGVATGGTLFVLDSDPRHGGADSRAKLEARHGRLPTTPTVLTGGGRPPRMAPAP